MLPSRLLQSCTPNPDAKGHLEQVLGTPAPALHLNSTSQTPPLGRALTRCLARCPAACSSPRRRSRPPPPLRSAAGESGARR